MDDSGRMSSTIGGSIARNAIRIAGFSLYWAQLFMVAVSPSALFGNAHFIAGIPFEIPQIAFRCLALVAYIAWISRAKGASPVGAAVAAGAAGPFVSVLLLAAPGNMAAFLGAAALAGFVDTALLLVWLGSFSHAKLGDMALSIASSYAIGSLFCLASAYLGTTAMAAMSLAAPMLSSVLFLVHHRRESRTAQDDVAQDGTCDTLSKMPTADRHMAIALTVYALLFGFFSSASVYGIAQTQGNPLVQSVACVILFAVFAALIRVRTENQGLYDMYRIVPLLFACGFAIVAFGNPAANLLAGILVNLAYDSFEALAYNDFANILKTSRSFSSKPMAQLRLGASVGMLVGWITAPAVFKCLAGTPLGVTGIIVFIGVALSTVVVTFVFTDKHAEGLGFIANQRAAQELSQGQDRRQALIEEYTEVNSLSPRESEVFQYLLTGRTIAYAAEELFISESTARTHVHNIYSKTGTHSRMELLDDFERFTSERS